MPTEPLDLDAYTPLSGKAVFEEASIARLSPPWVPAEERRRLAAYHVLAAYLANGARSLLASDSPGRDSLREYGDPSLLVDRIVAGVLGEGWTLVVDGADLDLAQVELPERPEAPETPEGQAPSPAARLAALQVAEWERQTTQELDRLEAAAEALPALQARQEELRAWADRVQLAARIDEGEHDAAGMGDGIYVLWPQIGDWPQITCMDPASYFPQLDDGAVVQFPDTVTFAWQYEERQPDGERRRMLRRITFELVGIAETKSDGVTWLDGEGNAVDAPQLAGADAPTPEALLADGSIVRRYPWQDADAPPVEWSPTTCLMSDGVWDLGNTSISGLADLSDSAATWTLDALGRPIRNLDLMQDFLPVIHNPNTTNSKEHFGRSVLLGVAQILDDLARADTDTMQASRYLSDPTMALSGAKVSADTSTVAPGRVYGLGENGRMDVLDLSAGLERLMAHREALADRFWQNGRVPDVVAGRVDATQAAGIAIALSFAPYAQLIGGMRMARDPKYRLIPKFAQRMAQVQGALEPGPTPVARMAWGNFLPTNRTETVELVKGLLEAHAISVATAVRMLVAAGLPIEDATAEVEAIREEDPRRAAAAKDIADATGSEAAAASWYGIDVPAAASPATGPAPQPNLPPV